MAKVAVIGGGLAGLCAAHWLRRRKHSLVLIEAEATLGGQIQTEHSAGHCIELGAEGFVRNSDALPQLAAAVGLRTELMEQSLTRSLGYRAGELRELAPGEAASFLGFQVSRKDMGAGIRTFARGMGSLIDALAASLEGQIEIHTSSAVQTLERKARGYRITTQDEIAVDAEKLVIATSARPASRLLTGLLGTPAAQLAQVELMSSVTVSLAYERDHVPHPLDATGFVIATEDQVHGARACTFTSSKFDGRAPEGEVSLRVFFRPSDADIKLVSDAGFEQRAREVLGRVLGITQSPRKVWVSRWPLALPVFDEAHRARVQSLEQALAGSGVALAGSAFHGAGIDAAVRSALSVHERL
jgi:oxygen-dependent protoporphyrinogen oxidase